MRALLWGFVVGSLATEDSVDHERVVDVGTENVALQEEGNCGAFGLNDTFTADKNGDDENENARDNFEDEGEFHYDEDDDFDDFDEEEDDEEDEEDYDDEDEEHERTYSSRRTPFTEFRVAGVNLADYGTAPLFELYEDFDISEFIQGDEDWQDLLAYRNQLERPSLSFYVDKVARKRWLPTMGYNQPALHALLYRDELESTTFSGQRDMILNLLPVNQSYAAKPTHKSETDGNWLVDVTDGKALFSTSATTVTNEDGDFDATSCANSLTRSINEPPRETESWALHNVKPGLVIEERWSSHENIDAPPHEFNIFTIWGKVWVGQWNMIEGQSRHWNAFVHRNGTVALPAGEFTAGDVIPDWIPWDELISIAEELGAHKDMFRTDVFLGRPTWAFAEDGDGGEDAPLEIAVSECEIFPTTVFDSDEFTGEGARLWVAGYQMGIYESIENDEVPIEYLETGMLSPH